MKIKAQICLILTQHFRLTLESMYTPNFFFSEYLRPSEPEFCRKLYREMLISRFTAVKYHLQNV